MTSGASEPTVQFEIVCLNSRLFIINKLNLGILWKGYLGMI